MMKQSAVAEERETRQTGQEVYTAAVRLISERGYHGMSFRALAAEVGLQMSSLYHYFPSKQALLFQIMDRTMRDLMATVRDSVSRAEGPAEKLRAAIRAHVLFHANRREEAFITDSELRALERSNSETIIGLRDDYERIFLDILEEGIRRRAFRSHDVKLAVYSLMATCTGVAVWFRPGGRRSLEEIADFYFWLFVEGIAEKGRPSGNS